MKLKYILIFCLALVGCLDLLAQDADFLLIIGDNVNVREEPSVDSKVSAQFNNGQSCYITASTQFFETIGKKTDFWYQVSADGKKGWVFGGSTSKKLSDNPQLLLGIYKTARRDGNLHIFFESMRVEELGWKGHGTVGINTWDFGYGDKQNKYGKYKLAKGGKKGDLTVPKYKDKAFQIEWKVAPMESGRAGILLKEVPVILSIKKVKTSKKAGKIKEPKTPKGEKPPKEKKVKEQ